MMIHSVPTVPGAGVVPNAANNIIAGLLERHTGQQIAPARNWRIEAALKTVMRDREFLTIDALEREIKNGGDAKLEQAVVEALLNHETSFFRDAPLLGQLVDGAAAIQQKFPDRRLRIWSAGCAHGQEPLSLAMLFAEAEKAGRMRFPEIYASDVSAHSIERAKAGRYSQFEVQRGLPITRLIEWFEQSGDEWVVKRELLDRIWYRRHNLARDLPPASRFDLVLCRNVLMYFATEKRGRILDQFADLLGREGLVVLGAGETVIGQCSKLGPNPDYRGFYSRV